MKLKSSKLKKKLLADSLLWEVVNDLFDKFDKDKDGFLDPIEL